MQDEKPELREWYLDDTSLRELVSVVVVITFIIAIINDDDSIIQAVATPQCPNVLLRLPSLNFHFIFTVLLPNYLPSYEQQQQQQLYYLTIENRKEK